MQFHTCLLMQGSYKVYKCDLTIHHILVLMNPCSKPPSDHPDAGHGLDNQGFITNTFGFSVAQDSTRHWHIIALWNNDQFKFDICIVCLLCVLCALNMFYF